MDGIYITDREAEFTINEIGVKRVTNWDFEPTIILKDDTVLIHSAFLFTNKNGELLNIKHWKHYDTLEILKQYGDSTEEGNM